MFAGTTAMTFRSELLLLYAARGVRGFGDGFAVIILPVYLSAIGFTPVEIGFVATAALLGSSLLTLAVGFVAPRHDLRNMLLLGAGLMVATGIAFPQFEHIAFVLLVAFVGTIFGPVVGAFFIVTVENYLTHIGQWVLVVQGVIFVGCVLLFRRGIVGGLMRLLRVKL